MGYGSGNNAVYREICELNRTTFGSTVARKHRTKWDLPPTRDNTPPIKEAIQTHTVLRHVGFANILPYIHTTLEFVACRTPVCTLDSPQNPGVSLREPSTLRLGAVLHLRPYEVEPVRCVEQLALEYELGSLKFSSDFKLRRPLPEDFAMRGLLWMEGRFPDDWVFHPKFGNNVMTVKLACMGNEQRERTACLRKRLAREYQQLPGPSANPISSPLNGACMSGLRPRHTRSNRDADCHNVSGNTASITTSPQSNLRFTGDTAGLIWSRIVWQTVLADIICHGLRCWLARTRNGTIPPAGFVHRTTHPSISYA